MIKQRRFFVLIELFLGMLVAILAGVMILGERIDSSKRIYVVVPDSDNNSRNAFKYGLKTAAREFDMDLVVVSTGDFSDLSEEESVVYRELKNNADAMIIEPVYGENDKEILGDIQNNITSMLVYSSPVDDEGNTAFSCVKSDNFQLGSVLGIEIIKDYTNILKGKKIIVVTDELKGEKNEKRIEGLKSELEDKCKEIKIVATDEGEEFLSNNHDSNILIGLDDNSTQICGEYKKNNIESGIKVYGIGCSQEVVYYVDNGFVECLVAPDEYNIGYQSMRILSGYLRGILNRKAMDSETVGFYVLRQNNLFSGDNQRLLFSLSQ